MRSGKAISAIAIAAVVVVVVAIAGLGGYLLLAQAPTASNTQTSSNAQVTSISSSQSSLSGTLTSSQSSTTLSTSSSSSISHSSTSILRTSTSYSGTQSNSSILESNIQDGNQLLGNFSSLMVQFTGKCVGYCTKAAPNGYSNNVTETDSYKLSGTRAINATTYHVYNITINFNRNGNGQIVNEQFLLAPGNGQSYTIYNGTTTATSATDVVQISYGFDNLVSSGKGYPSGLLLNQSSTVLDGVHLSLSAYSATEYNGELSGNGTTTVIVATLPGTNVVFPVSLLYVVPSTLGFQYTGTLRVTSLSTA